MQPVLEVTWIIEIDIDETVNQGKVKLSLCKIN
jgi:hypothetical protein